MSNPGDKLDAQAIAKRLAARKAKAQTSPLAGSVRIPKLPDLSEETRMQIPDVVGTCDGWRAWGVRSELPDSGVPLLQSVTFGAYIWQPREVQTAKCTISPATRRNKNIPSGHLAPDERCTCGNYSAKTLEHLQSMHYHYYDAEALGLFHVIGEVANWGKVVEGTQGWRAQHSYPRTLYVPYEAWHLALPLQRAYGVPVKLKNFLGFKFEKGSEEVN